jgi:hypothetical protein
MSRALEKQPCRYVTKKINHRSMHFKFSVLLIMTTKGLDREEEADDKTFAGGIKEPR